MELTKSSSFLNKKPILKKRSVSELMLQRSLSTSSLLKQATAAVQAQKNHDMWRPGRPRMGPALSDYVALPLSSRRVSPGNSSLVPSLESSGFISPSVERKHIHFNEQVEQCIAVDARGEGEDESEPPHLGYDSGSNDGIAMMKRTSFKKRRPLLRRKSSNNDAENKTIATLPSTTLKSRDNSPGPNSGTPMKNGYRSPVLSPSSSQEALRPARLSGGLFLMNDEDDEEEDGEKRVLVRQTSTLKPSKRLDSPHSSGSSGFKGTTSIDLLSKLYGPMRRTESGMPMPHDEGEPAGANAGIVGRAIDTVNTARDIAYFICNVGWRK